MSIKLGVNIDHVATLRQARGESYPSLVDTAYAVLDAGAHQITIHLREDRRHIQDFDVPAIKLVTQKFGVPLNLEMGTNKDILEIAYSVKPEWICLVPEKREELTTEGGLNLYDSVVCKRTSEFCDLIKKNLPDTKISLFVEADLKVLEKAVAMNIDAVEIHTGEYAIAYLNQSDINHFLEQFTSAHTFVSQHNILFHAGHGLTDSSLLPLVEQGLFVEYNIGHWIICQSIFDGIKNVTKKLLGIIDKDQ